MFSEDAEEKFFDLTNAIISERDKGFIDKKISMDALYEYHYGLNQSQAEHPFSGVLHLPSTKGDGFTIMSGMFKRYIKLGIYKETGIDMTAFLRLPPYMTKMVFDQAQEKYDIKQEAEEKEGNEIKRMRKEIS